MGTILLDLLEAAVRHRFVIFALIVLALAGGLFYMLREPHETGAPQPAKHADKIRTLPVNFDLVRLSREGMGVIAGTATPGSFVDVMSEGRSLGKSRASDAGAWEVVVGTALPTGTHILGLTATDGQGQETRSADVAVVDVPPPAPKEPVKQPKAPKPPKGEKKPEPEDGVLAVLMPRQGGAAGRVLQRPGQLKPTLTLGIDTADFDAGGQTVLAGHAGAGNEVSVYLDGQPVGKAEVDDNGFWSVALDGVAARAHNIRLEETDSTSAVVLSVEQAYDPASSLAFDLGDKPALVRADQAVWHIVHHIGDAPVRYTQVFHADQGVKLDQGDTSKEPGTLKPGATF
jgi:hypothetical protein